MTRLVHVLELIPFICYANKHHSLKLSGGAISTLILIYPRNCAISISILTYSDKITNSLVK